MKFAFLAAAACLLTACGSSSPGPAPAAKEEAPKPAKIVQFYSSSKTVAPGQQVLICYGVENAKSVRLDPPIQQITPSYIRCFQHGPTASSEYKLIATGADGTEVTKSIKIDVGGAAPSPKGGDVIVSFVPSAKSVPAGQEVTLCYDTRNASSVKIEPESSGRTLPVKGCISEKVSKTTKFTLTAQTADGKQDHESLTVSVQP
jgi:hypothetical protein